MKTSELVGPNLNLWVARAAEIEFTIERSSVDWCVQVDGGFGRSDEYDPSTNWAQGGPIIERERIDLRHRHDIGGAMKGSVFAHPRYKGHAYAGPTPLIAAMRSYVASKFGDEVPDGECL